MNAATYFLRRLELIPTIASKFMIDTGAGVIDADYRGIVFVLLFNHSDKDFQGTFHLLSSSSTDQNTIVVEEGDRIAQLIIERIYTPDVLEVDVSSIQTGLTSKC